MSGHRIQREAEKKWIFPSLYVQLWCDFVPHLQSAISLAWWKELVTLIKSNTNKKNIQYKGSYKI